MFKRWCAVVEADERAKLRESILFEEFINCSRPSVATHVGEQKPKTLPAIGPLRCDSPALSNRFIAATNGETDIVQPAMIPFSSRCHLVLKSLAPHLQRVHVRHYQLDDIWWYLVMLQCFAYELVRYIGVSLGEV